jgi:hypothetical protein
VQRQDMHQGISGSHHSGFLVHGFHNVRQNSGQIQEKFRQNLGKT